MWRILSPRCFFTACWVRFRGKDIPKLGNELAHFYKLWDVILAEANRTDKESWKRDKEETGCQPPEGPVLCSNGCGFFGSFSTMNLCSKCYADLVLKQAKATSAKAAAEKVSLNSCLQNDTSAEVTDQSVIGLTSIETHADASPASSECSNARQASLTGSSEPVHLRKRCFACKKRIGLTGFKCRCGNSFCSLHRYSDKHSCSYDYKSAGRDAIAQANPVVKAARVQNKI